MIETFDGLSVDEQDNKLFDILAHDFETRKQCNDFVKSGFGKTAYERAIVWWKNGWLSINAYGYVHVTKRGYRIMENVRDRLEQKLLGAKKDE
jgi:hypothetical protein